MKYSKYQSDFFRETEEMFMGDDTKYILLSAVAGSGKTFSIVESIKFLPRHTKTRFFAFNKSIADELSKKLPKSVHTSTIHSFGMRMISDSVRCKIKVDQFKHWKFIEEAIKAVGVEFQNTNKKNGFVFNMMKVVDMFRVNLCELTGDGELDRAMINDLVMNYSIEPSFDIFRVFQVSWSNIKKYNDSIFKGGYKEISIDFTDMIYIPVYYKNFMIFPEYDVVYADEVQDLSTCQQELVKLVIGNGKGVMVGDEKQSIYGFAGADIHSWRKLQSLPKVKQLPLSVCYRCAKKIVEKAQTVYDHIQPFHDQIDGVVEEDGDVYDAEAGDFVLCRNTKPLIKLWYGFLAEGKKAFVKGDEDKENLLKLAKKVDGMSVEQGIYNLNLDLAHMCEVMINAGIENPRENRKYIERCEMIECLRMIADNSNLKQISEVIKHLDYIFSGDASEKICMMTMHRSKGLESDNVFIIMMNLLPSKWAKTSSQIEQERNLEYVAYTRAKKKLVIDRKFSDK